MRLFLALLSIFLIFSPCHSNARVVLHSIKDVRKHIKGMRTEDVGVDVTGIISSIDGTTFILEDGASRIFIEHKQHRPFAVGQVVHLQGTCWHLENQEVHIDATNICVIGKASPAAPVRRTLSDLINGDEDLLPVAVVGQVVSVQPDEVDTNYHIMLLRDQSSALPVLFETKSISTAKSYIDTSVCITGVFHRAIRGVRRHSGPYIAGSTIDIVAPAPAEPFDIPMLETTPFTAPADIARLGKRKVCGRVLATWGASRAMIWLGGKNIANLAFRDGTPLPPVEALIEAVGYPETDLFRINLRNAQWRIDRGSASADETMTGEPPSFEGTDQLLYDAKGASCFRGDAHGALVRLNGIVRTLPPEEGSVRRFYIDAERDKVPVDVTTHPEAAAGIQIGAEINVTGRWLIEAGVPSQFDVFPQINGYALVVRSADDVRIVRNPPWWTPMRCLAAVLGLLAVLVAIVLWNLSLRVLVRRRAKQLRRAEIDRERSALRVKERTSLAADLHDALSQNLTGISFELKAAALAFKHDRNDGFERLAGASKALQSCRTELKNCIWDLRNDALGQGDMNEAIRRAVLPYLGSADLRIRISIPRTRISDNTAHAILRIIRELVTNAVRHGAARKVRIAGSYDNGFIRFSVQDDGSGFDPAAAPGMADGHFGLHGIRERLAALNGTLHLESRAGRGTKVTITLQ